MSTNKTEHYDLHAWAPEDSFLLSEVNENFAKLDAALNGKIVVGQYTGDGEKERIIDLGGRPLAIFIETNGGYRTSGTDVLGGLMTENQNMRGFAYLDDRGIRTIQTGRDPYLNRLGETYYYAAFF